MTEPASLAAMPGPALGRFLLHTIPLVESTQDAIRALPPEPWPALLAERQSRGRGRQGRAWTDPAGALSLSISVSGQQPLPLFLAASLSVIEAMAALAPALTPDLALKWPNDLLLQGRKLAGMLIEGDGRGRHIIGIGLNRLQAPTGTPWPAIALAEVLDPREVPAPQALAEALIRHLDRNLGHPADVLLQQYRDRLAFLDRPIRLQTPQGLRDGRFAGITPQGLLTLDPIPPRDGRQAPPQEFYAVGEILPIETEADPCPVMR